MGACSHNVGSAEAQNFLRFWNIDAYLHLSLSAALYIFIIKNKLQ